MRENKESEIIRLFLNGSSIDYISRRFNISSGDVISVLLANPATAEVVRSEHEKVKKGKFSNAFYKSKLGRDKLPDNKRRKLRQIRISDNEMNKMGNPSSTEIRNRALNYSLIFEIIDLLDEKGLIEIPEEWFDFDLSDPFWARSIQTQADKLRYLLNNKHLINRASKDDAK